MSVDDYENCLRGEYNLDAEAVQFIIQIYQLGGESAIEQANRAWSAIPETWKKYIEKLGGAAAGRLLTKTVGVAVAELLGAMVAGLGVAAVALALGAASACVPKLAQ